MFTWNKSQVSLKVKKKTKIRNRYKYHNLPETTIWESEKKVQGNIAHKWSALSQQVITRLQ